MKRGPTLRLSWERKKIIMIDLKRQPLSMVMPEEVQEPQTRCKEGDNAHHTSDTSNQAPEEDSCLCLEEWEGRVKLSSHSPNPWGSPSWSMLDPVGCKSSYKYLSHYLEPKEAFFKAEDFYMEYSRGLQAPDDREDDEGIRSHCHPKHLIQGEECLKSSNCCSLGKRLSQQQESQLQGDLEEDLQTLKTE